MKVFGLQSKKLNQWRLRFSGKIHIITKMTKARQLRYLIVNQLWLFRAAQTLQISQTCAKRWSYWWDLAKMVFQEWRNATYAVKRANGQFLGTTLKQTTWLGLKFRAKCAAKCSKQDAHWLCILLEPIGNKLQEIKRIIFLIVGSVAICDDYLASWWWWPQIF